MVHVSRHCRVFTYDSNCSQDLWTRIGKATEVTKSVENIWKSKNITNDTKKRILETTAFNTVLYGCETWTYNKKIRDKLLAFVTILCISWTERKTNREICEKLIIEKDLLQRTIQIVNWTSRGEQFGPRSRKMETHYKPNNGHQWALVPWFLKKKIIS